METHVFYVPNWLVFSAHIPLTFLDTGRQLFTMLRSVIALLYKPKTLLVVYAAIALIAAVQLVLVPPHIFEGKTYTDYNNYIIFRQSFFHLIKGENMYILYPDEHWDLYKYSPTFALIMGIVAHLPDMMGLCLWNLLNALALFAAIRMLPFNVKTQSLLMWFVALELLTSLQNAQSNGLMCGLMIAAYACMEREKVVWAALWLVVATFIKVYGAIGFCMLLFYPGKIRFVFYALLWTIILAAMPLAVTPFQTLVWQYHNWATMMAADAAASWGISVSGWLHTWFGVSTGRTFVTLIGAVLFLTPLLRYRLYRNEVYRLLMLASMLIWVIIFNHKAESPTYIIAVAGVGIWYFAMPKAGWRTALFWLVFIFTSLGTTDIFPPFIKDHFLRPYTVKAFPCIVVWCVLVVDLLQLKMDAVLPVLEKRSTNENIALN